MTICLLLLAISVPVGWWATYDLFYRDFQLYALLSMVALVALAVGVANLGRDLRREIHLWILLIVFWMAYYVKFYVLTYLVGKGEAEAAGAMFGAGIYAVTSQRTLLEAYWFVTASWGTLCICVAVMGRRFGVRPSTEGRLNKSSEAGSRTGVGRRRMCICLTLGILLSVLTAVLQAYTGIGVASLRDPELPYRLAGVLQYLRTDVIPMLLLLLVWLADATETPIMWTVGVVVYLLHGATSSILSTSRSHFILAVVSLAILWLVSGEFSRRRLILLLGLVPVTLLLGELLAFARAIRAGGEIGALRGFHIAASTAAEFGQLQDTAYRIVVASVLRVNGIDSLLYIIDYGPWFSQERIWAVIGGSAIDVNHMYARDVLGYGELIGVAYSTSLLGFLYFVSGNKALAIMGLVAYGGLWHIVFRLAGTQRLIVSPVLMTILSTALIKYTSEGSLQALPFNLLVIAGMGIVLESLGRGLGGRRVKGGKPISRYSRLGAV